MVYSVVVCCQRGGLFSPDSDLSSDRVFMGFNEMFLTISVDWIFSMGGFMGQLYTG